MTILLNPYRFVVGTSWDADAAAYFAAWTTPPDDTRAGLLNDLVLGLKADTVWPLLDRLPILASPTAQSARLDARSPAKSLSAVNVPTFTADRGYSGDNVSAYLDFGEPFAFAGANFSQNSASLGAWVNQQGSGNGEKPTIGCAGASFAKLSGRNNAGNANYKINDNTLTALEINPVTRLGHRAASRTSAANKAGYVNGTPVGSTAVASTAPATVNGALLRDVSTYSADRIAVAYSGGALSDAQHAALHARLNTFLTAIGAN